MVRIAIAGAAGRMGGRILALARADQREYDVVATLEKTGHPDIGMDAGEKAGLGRIGLPIQDRTETEFDVLIDFTTPEGTMHWLDYCVVCKRAIIIGTTGHTAEPYIDGRIASFQKRSQFRRWLPVRLGIQKEVTSNMYTGWPIG